MPVAPYLLLRGDACRLPLADRSVDLVFGSPPYVKQRKYLEDGKDLEIARGPDAWIDWMLDVTTEALRVCRGPVVWVAAGPTRGRCYQPVCEGLQYLWWKRGGECHLYRPCFWHRVGIAGSGGDQWFRHDVEYVMCFKRPGKLPWSDNTATGHPPKWAPGGAMSHRLSNGSRVNQWGGRKTSGRGKTPAGTVQEPGRPSHRYEAVEDGRGRLMLPAGERRAHGEVQAYIPPDLANPGNLIRTGAGKGHMGNDLAHENEAPFPEDLAERFIRSLCPPGGVVLDNFSGSGTTVAVAERLGRKGIGIDLRQSQCLLAGRRIAHPHRPRPRGRKVRRPLPSQMTLFAEV